jgi:hypothetical protein
MRAAARHVAVVAGRYRSSRASSSSRARLLRESIQELAAQLVVCDFRDQKLVLSNRATEPGTDIVMLARVTDLPEHAGIEDESHVLEGSPAEPWRTVIGSRSSTFHSGSPETSSESHRSSIAATRAARSAISLGDVVSACFVGREGETISPPV